MAMVWVPQTSMKVRPGVASRAQLGGEPAEVVSGVIAARERRRPVIRASSPAAAPSLASPSSNAPISRRSS